VHAININESDNDTNIFESVLEESKSKQIDETIIKRSFDDKSAEKDIEGLIVEEER
jgi:hypothetical protein